MRIAIVHYHARPAGVTRVMRETSQALSTLGITNVILTGEAIKGLSYSQGGDPQALAANLREAAINSLGGPPHAWIFHNPTLGKNRDIPEVITHFAEKGETILLHIHDLAEDGRPENFTNIPDPARLHFTAANIHHAFINTRDHAIFLQAGLPPHRAHLLPNPVTPASWLEHPAQVDSISPTSIQDSASALIFYPVRGIRRKNLGELCLLAALSPPGTRFAVSRAPENPSEFAAHDFWHQFAITYQLSILFDVTDRIPPAPNHSADFESWAHTTTHWISTSIAEGFGQTIAEATARCKPLIARALDAGFSPTDTHGIYHIIDADTSNQDFATLSESAQAEIIQRVLTTPQFAHTIRIDHTPAREWLHDRIKFPHVPAPDPKLIPHQPQNVANTLLRILQCIIKGAGNSGSSGQVSPDPHITQTIKSPPTFLSQQKVAALYKKSAILLSHPRPTLRTKFPRAIIFDIYGTLLDALPGGVRPDAAADSIIITFLKKQHVVCPPNPTQALAELVQREHHKSPEPYPEIDLIALWAELLNLPIDAHTTQLVAQIEDLWHPASPMPGVMSMLRKCAALRIPCGLLSNAQANIWQQLGPIAPCFAADLCVFSYQHRRAKPSPALFESIRSQLALRDISPGESWFIGNDPECDIVPASNAGFRTAIYGNAPSAIADLRISSWGTFEPTAIE